jgi:peptidoglycan hydrolase-like protein with peptidoglycan-binding domain
MSLRTFGVVALLLLAPLSGIAADAFTSLHPEAAVPDPTGQNSPDPYTGFISRVQQELRALGFDAGPVNGDFGTKTQAALAQFQLSRAIPASGQLDDQTLAELGIKRDDPQASAGASTDTSEPETGVKPGS